MQRMSEKKVHGRGLRIIAAFKLLKACSLVALGVGALKLLHKDLAGLVERILRVTPKQLKELSVGTFFYAGLFATEGFGLLLRKRWAEYFTIITTSSLLPIEIYELLKRVSLGRSLALAINLAVVAYLILELRRFPKQQ